MLKVILNNWKVFLLSILYNTVQSEVSSAVCNASEVSSAVCNASEVSSAVCNASEVSSAIGSATCNCNVCFVCAISNQVEQVRQLP